MANVGSLFVVLGLKATDYQNGLKKAAKDANTAMRTIKKEFDSLDLKRTAAEVGALGTAFLLIQKRVMDTAGGFQQMQVSLDTITRGQGKKWFNDLLSLSMELPISINATVKAYQRMKSMGLDPTIQQMRVLLDVQSAMGGDEEIMLGIARALGQMAAKGKVSAEELMQLAERGIPSYQILKDKLNLTSKEVYNIGNMAVDSQKAIAALFTGMGEMFGGNAAKMANTYAGQITIIKNQLLDMQRVAGNMAMPQIIEQLKAANQYLKQNKFEIAADIGKTIQKTAESIQFLIDNRDAVVFAIEAMFGAYAINKLVKFATSIEAIYKAMAKLITVMGAGALPTAGLAGVGAATVWGAYETIKNPNVGPYGPGTSPYGRFDAGKKYPYTLPKGFDITAGTVAGGTSLFDRDASFYAQNHRPVIEAAKKAAEEENKLLLSLQKEYARDSLDLIRDEGKRKLAEINLWYKEEQAAAKGNVEALRMIDKMRSQKLDIYDIWHQEQMDKATTDRQTWIAKIRDNIREDRKKNQRASIEEARENQRKEAEFIKAETDKMKQETLEFSRFWADTLLSVVEQSGNAFSNIGRMFEEMIKKMMIRATLMGAINAIMGGAGGFVGGFGHALNLPGFAGGGNYQANKPFIAGERGPEIIYPKSAGTVIPNNAIGSDYSSWQLNFYDTASERKQMTLDDDSVFASKFRRCVRDGRIDVRELSKGVA